MQFESLVGDEVQSVGESVGEFQNPLEVRSESEELNVQNFVDNEIADELETPQKPTVKTTRAKPKKKVT
jgi:hypothetical protein